MISPTSHTWLVFGAFGYVHGVTMEYKMVICKRRKKNSLAWNCIGLFLLPEMALIFLTNTRFVKVQTFSHSQLYKTHKIVHPEMRCLGVKWTTDFLSVLCIRGFMFPTYSNKVWILKLVIACFKGRSLFRIQNNRRGNYYIRALWKDSWD